MVRNSGFTDRWAAVCESVRGAFLDQLGNNTDGDFRDTLGLNVQANGASDLRHLFLGGNSFFDKLVEDQARLAAAADHAQKSKRAMNPFAQDQGIVLMTAGDNQTKRRA